jgi:hypothetical protein
MKTIQLAGLAMILLATACNSNGKGDEAEDTTSTIMGPVENVNGNMPDTTNSINVGSDTTQTTIDTTPH